MKLEIFTFSVSFIDLAICDWDYYEILSADQLRLLAILSDFPNFQYKAIQTFSNNF